MNQRRPRSVAAPARGVALMALAGLMAASTAAAHGLTGGQVGVQMQGSTAIIIMTPPASAFSEADANHDGSLDRAEIDASRQKIIAEAFAAVSFKDQAGAEGERYFTDVLVGRDHHAGAEGAFVKIISRHRWAAAPGALTVRYGLFGGASDGVTLTVSAPSAASAAGELSPSALRAQGQLTPSAPEVRVELATSSRQAPP